MKTRKRLSSVLMTCCLMINLIFSLTGCGNEEPISKTGFYFDTVITITLYHASEASYIDDCFAMADHYEKLFSNTIPDSDISKINQSGETPVAVSDETVELLQIGLDYSEKSQGRFDITIGKLSSLWDFSNNQGTVPGQDLIRDAKNTIDYHNVNIDGNMVSLTNPDTMLDLGGIAKGYIADKMKEHLMDQGVSEGIINLGGNVLVIGDKEDHSGYTIGIQYPFAETGEAIASMKLHDQTIVSSGVYERYFYADDRLYHHLLDPSTGYPYENELLSVTVICDHSVDGDALSTTLFAMGLEDGMDYVESLPDTEAVFITNDDQLHCSSGIGDEIKILK